MLSEAGTHRQVPQYSFNSWAQHIVFAENNWSHSQRSNKVEFHLTKTNCEYYSIDVETIELLLLNEIKQIHLYLSVCVWAFPKIWFFMVSHNKFGFNKSIENELENTKDLIWNRYRETKDIKWRNNDKLLFHVYSAASIVKGDDACNKFRIFFLLIARKQYEFDDITVCK